MTVIDGAARKLDTLMVSPLIRQSTVAVLFAVALVITVAAPPRVAINADVVLTATSLLVLATLLSGVFTARTSLWKFGTIVPAIDFIAIGLLSIGAGASYSILVALPLVWFASLAGRWNIVWAAAGSTIALTMPLIIGGITGAVHVGAPEIVRAAFTPVVLAVVAVMINELSRRAHLQAKSAAVLAEQRRISLEESARHAAELGANEAKLRSAERMFRGVWEAVTEQAVIGTDLTGRIDAFNPGAERMLGLPPSQVERRMRIDHFHVRAELEERARDLAIQTGESDIDPLLSALVEPVRLGGSDVREWTYVRGDGTQLPVEVSITPRMGDEGEIVGYLFVVNDVTKAREVSKLKDEFVGLISHELRTPLSSILGYLELMRDEDEEELSETQLQYLGVAERNANRLLRLVGDLLFTAQVDSGKFNVEQHEIDLSTIVTASVQSALPAAAAHGVTLTGAVSDIDLVLGDGVRLGQACDNMISNAIKFTPNGGLVTVGLRSDGDDAIITVRDTGLGIAADEIEKLFSRFFRAATATRNAVPGVGLGLVITRAIVTAHGGSMDVESEEGVGTCFTMRVPLAQRAALIA